MQNPHLKYFCQEKLAQTHLVDFPSVGNKITAFCGRVQLISNARRKNRDQPTNSIINRIGFSISDKDKSKPWYIRVPPVKSVSSKLFWLERRNAGCTDIKSRPCNQLVESRTPPWHTRNILQACWHECIESIFVELLVWPSNYQLFIFLSYIFVVTLVWSGECCHLVDVVIFVAVSHAQSKQQHGLRPDCRPVHKYVSFLLSAYTRLCVWCRS